MSDAPAAGDESLGGLGGVSGADELYFGRDAAKDEHGHGGDNRVNIVVLEGLGRCRNFSVVNRDDSGSKCLLEIGVGLEMGLVCNHESHIVFPSKTYLSAKDLDFVLASSDDSLDQSAAEVASASCNSDDGHDAGL